MRFSTGSIPLELLHLNKILSSRWSRLWVCCTSHHIMNRTKCVTEPAMFYRWKGETLSAISSTSEFAENRKIESDKIFEELKEDISEWFDPKLLLQHERKLHELILEPAVDFQSMIHCSGMKFELQWEWAGRVQSPVPEDLMGWDLIDIASWRVYRNSDIKGVFKRFFPGLTMKLAMDQSNVSFQPGASGL